MSHRAHFFDFIAYVLFLSFLSAICLTARVPVFSSGIVMLMALVSQLMAIAIRAPEPHLQDKHLNRK